MNCRECGAETQANAVYCPQCGARIESPDAALFGAVEREAPAAQPPQSPGDAGAGQPLAPASQSAPPRPAREASAGAGGPGFADSETLWEGRYDVRGMVDRLVLSGLVTVAVLALWIWWQPSGTWWLVGLALLGLLWLYQFLVYVKRHYGHRYRLTPQTFFHESGILIRSSSPIEIIAIDDISYQQTLLERLLGVGTIRIVSADRSDPELVLRGIRDVAKAFGVIDQARRAERRRRAVRVDNV